MTDQAALRLKRARAWWIFLMLAALVAFVAIYWWAVLTPTGQQMENAALEGAKLAAPAEVQDARDSLDVISKTSLIIATLIVATIGFIHGGFQLGATGVAIVALGVGSAEVLKRFVLPRPDLIDAPSSIAHNSYPSGHTAIAMTLLIAVLVVTPYRWRGVATALTMAWATAIGAATLAARWHRLSDTLGATAIAVGVGALASLYLLSRGRVAPTQTKKYPLRVIYVTLSTIGGVASLALGLTLSILVSTRLTVDTNDYRIGLYDAAHALSLGICVLAALLFWATWHRLEIPKRH